PTHTLRPVLFLWRVVVCLRVRALPSSTLFPYTTLFRSNATPHLVAPGEGGVQVFACLRRLAGWISLRMRTRGSVKKNSRGDAERSEEHTSELLTRENLVCRLLLEKKKQLLLYRCFIMHM